MDERGLSLIKAAKEFGFAEAGVVDLLPLVESPDSPFAAHRSRYDEWLSRGFAGEMGYLERGRDRRHDPRIVFPEALSVFCVLWPYRKKPAGRSPEEGVRYARYLEGKDYHDVLKNKLEEFLDRFSSRSESDLSLRWKVCVDTSAVLERTWASLCGLGWIGKNTLLIHPKHGSYHFIGVALLNRGFGAEPKRHPDYCGNCTRCLSACPTQAFVEPGWLDSRKCISYLTLEKRGSWDASPEVLTKIGNWVAGCDICQEVCPFNQKAVKQDLHNPESEDLGAIAVMHWRDLLEESEEDYRVRIRDSSLSRVKPAQFRRNLALAMRMALEDEGEALLKLKPLIQKKFAQEKDEAAKEQFSLLLKAIEKSESLT